MGVISRLFLCERLDCDERFDKEFYLCLVGKKLYCTKKN